MALDTEQKLEIENIAKMLVPSNTVEANAYHFMALMKDEYRDDWHEHEDVVIKALIEFTEVHIKSSIERAVQLALK